MYPPKKKKEEIVKPQGSTQCSRLNKFLSNAGVCNRRQADELIKSGQVSVNGKVVDQVGTKVFIRRDKVIYNGKRVFPGEKVFILLNKPKDFVCITRNYEGKRTLLDLVKTDIPMKLYAVDHMDTHAMGLILITNDGNFAKEFAHSENPIIQLYKVELNKPLLQADLDSLKNGIKPSTLSVEVKEIAYADDTNKVIGIELKSNVKHIIEQLFEPLGYKIVSTDRVIYAGLTKKNLPRGNWRYLTEREMVQLKHFS